MIRRICSISVVVAVTFGAIALDDVSAQVSVIKPVKPKKAAPSGLPVVQIALQARAEPAPPLKYSLLPAFHKLRPGNAAPVYYRAILMLPRAKEQRFSTTQQEWLELPLGDLPKESVHRWLGAYQNVFRETRKAAYRENCEWDARLREMKGSEPYSILLPEIQSARDIGRALRVKAQLELSEERFDDALETLVMGYRLATNIAESPFLISDLVGIAIAGIMNEGVEQWIRSGGPNLYWALAELPDPMFDVRDAIEQEMNLPFQIFPFLRDPESVEYSTQRWRSEIAESVSMLAVVGGDDEVWRSQLAATGLLLTGYPAAKESLLQSGMELEEVEAMPVGQVVAIASSRAYQSACHEMLKWTYLPYWQAHRQMRESRAKIAKEGGFGSPGAFPGVLPVAGAPIDAAVARAVRLQRDIGALQTIEALRMFGADSGGKLPTTLEELKQCPVPIDPMTGRLFSYRVSGNKAILELLPPEGKMHESFGKRYELELDSSQK